MSVQVEGRILATDAEGYLRDRDDWDEAAATALAAQEGLTLTEAHWDILRLLRQFYAQFELSPNNRALVRYVKQQRGPEQGSSIYLMRLFGHQAGISPAKMAAKIAGLPKPDNCL